MSKNLLGKEELKYLIQLIKKKIKSVSDTKQDSHDDRLETEHKSIVEAINEVNTKAGQNGGLSQETDPTVHDWAKQPVKPTYSYDEIQGKPDLFSGNYDDLSNKPAIPSTEGLATEEYVDNLPDYLTFDSPEQKAKWTDWIGAFPYIEPPSGYITYMPTVRKDGDKITYSLQDTSAFLSGSSVGTGVGKLIKYATTTTDLSDTYGNGVTIYVDTPKYAKQAANKKFVEEVVNNFAETSVSDIGSAVAEETNELTIELKDKNGKVIATTKATLPTQEIPEVDLSAYVKAEDRDSFVIGGLTENAQTLSTTQKTTACEWLGAFPYIEPQSGYITYTPTVRKEGDKVIYVLQSIGSFLTLASIGADTGKLITYSNVAIDLSDTYGNRTTIYVDNPIYAKQAANKAYVDDTVATVESIAKGANQAVSFSNYQAMVSALASAPVGKYNVGQNIYINTLNVPDVWIAYVFETSGSYTYTDDTDVVERLKTSGFIMIGHYAISALETHKVDLTDYAKKEELENVTQLVDDFNADIAELYGRTDSLITYGTTDIGVGAELEEGKVYLVYEE